MFTFQDQNLLPLFEFVNIDVIFKEIVHQTRVKKYSPLDSLISKFRNVNNLDPSSVRVLFNGERVSETETPDDLGLTNGDLVELFEEMVGGGGSKKKNIAGDQIKILDVLQTCDVSEDESEISAEEIKEDMPSHMTIDQCLVAATQNVSPTLETISMIETSSQAKQLKVSFIAGDQIKILDVLQTCDVSEDESEISAEEIKEDMPSHMTIDQCLVAATQNVSPTLETISMIETSSQAKQLKVSFMKEQHDGRDLEKAENKRQYITTDRDENKNCKELKTVQDYQVEEMEPQEVSIDSIDKTHSCIENKQSRMKRNKRKHDKAEDRSQESKQMKLNEIEQRDLDNAEIQSYDNLYDRSIRTPKKKRIFLSKFPNRTPSPLTKLTDVTENEMRSFSVAVHVWAEERHGGTKMLLQRRLTEEHFKEILSFAGPGTRYNLLKGRSVLQYKALWRNIAMSNKTFRGHPESGFENKMRYHSSSKPFCPFEHCTTGILSPLNPLEVDLLMTPKRSLIPLGVTANLKNRNLFQQTKFARKKSHSTNTEQKTPTKEKLRREIHILTEKLAKYEQNEDEEETAISISIKLRCKKENCGKQFTTTFGLLKHMHKSHSAEDNVMIPEKCEICGKDFLYVDRHMKNAHSELYAEDICEICNKTVKHNIKKHRGVCVFCPHCGKEIKKKVRLLKHISKCKQTPEQSEAMDLSSPQRLDKSASKHTSKPINTKSAEYDVQKVNEEWSGSMQTSAKNTNLVQTGQNLSTVIQSVPQSTLGNSVSELKSKYIAISSVCDENKSIQIGEHRKDVNSSNNELNYEADFSSEQESYLHRKRICFPFDDKNEEDYFSEFEEDDGEEYTIRRRENKDKIELSLREIDELKNDDQEGDDAIIEQFRAFMKAICNVGTEESEGSKDIQPSTVGMYTRAIQKDLLPALHQLFNPFDSRWLLDCTTEKQTTFEGEERLLVSPKEPIYLTARILRHTLSRYGSSETGHQRATLVAAVAQFMNFIELQFNEKLNVWGRKPLEKIISYHNGVKSFINGTKVWKTCNKDRKKQLKNNQVLKEINNPNFEAEILEKYQDYLKSSERLDQIRKIAHFACKDVKKPGNKGMTEFSNVVMGEIVISSGCRPVAVYRMPVGAFTSKKPGFNPYRTTKDDRVLEEQHGEKQLYRRLNPNLPPKNQACEHQLKDKTAHCSVDCGKKCEPEGFNIYCDWDKTRDTKGPCYMHLAKPIKELLDLYDIIKSKFFKDIKSKNGPDWLNKETTPFFVNSSGSSFQQLDLNHISSAIGVEVTAYDFRRIVTTWAVSHESEEIRRYESETLQHADKVAYDHYVQNKQLKPQTLIQTYIAEEGVLPDPIREEINRAQSRSQSEILETNEIRKKRQQEALLNEKVRIDKIKMENKPLGPKQRVLGTDKAQLRAILENITGETIEMIVKRSKPTIWRQFIVRTLCSATGENGEDLINLWSKMYKGDLKYGVRDIRLRAKQKNWPRKDGNAFLQKHDRNTWIAGTILKAFQSEIKLRETKSYIELMK